MLFSSTIFLFLFLPFVLGLYFIIPKSTKNLFILFSSLFFYAWGEKELVLLMILSIVMNYLFGLKLSKLIEQNKYLASKWILGCGVSLNLIILIYYKYIGFLFESFNSVGLNLDIPKITLPIGISFFTFQSISYLIDVYRKEVEGQKNILNLGMYIALFPQLIAGPIVRYADIAKEIAHRTVTKSLFISGINRFIIGFSKKILIANSVALVADKIFDIPPLELSTSLSWIGIICYSLQIYYDFSGYSDMAIGLGRMFGFNFNENFQHPYSAKSMKEFWQRWHISLSSWFKDYLYIPLGGNRKGNIRTYINLFIIFFLTGLWHGSSWNFIIWGLFHGVFLISEKFLQYKIPKSLLFLSQSYVLLIVLLSWVFFRADNINFAFDYIYNMFVYNSGTNNYPYIFINNYVIISIIVGIIFSFPVRKKLEQKLNEIKINIVLKSLLLQFTYFILFLFSIFELAQNTYNPFIYFRF